MKVVIETYKLHYDDGYPLSEKLFSYFDEHSELDEYDYVLDMDTHIKIEVLDERGIAHPNFRKTKKGTYHLEKFYKIFDGQLFSTDIKGYNEEVFLIELVTYKPSTMLRLSGGTNGKTTYYLVLELNEKIFKVARFESLKDMKVYKAKYFAYREIIEYEMEDTFTKLYYVSKIFK